MYAFQLHFYYFFTNHRYVYTNDPKAPNPLYLSLIQQWLNLLEEKHDCIKDLDRYSWFIFRLITKSLTLDLDKSKLLPDSATRKIRLSEICCKKLEMLIEGLTEDLRVQFRANLALARSLNTHIAMFLSSLFDILDRGYIFKLIHTFSRRLVPGNEIMELVECKFAFFRIITAHDQYIPLSLPPTDVSTIPSITELVPTF